MAEGLIDSLSALPKVRVVPRSKAFRYRAEAGDPQHVGRELGVRAVLSGRITLRGDMLSVRAELIDVAKDAQLWGAQVSRVSNDVLEIQEEIAKQVRDKLQGPSSAGSKSKAQRAQLPKASPAVNKEAYQLYVRATHHTNKWTQEGIQFGIDLCRQAIDIDPAYAPPYATMAVGYAILAVLWGGVDNEHTLRQAKAYARKALDLDATLSEAHSALGFTSFMDFKVPEALEHGKRAVELNPGSGIAHYTHAQALACTGRVAEAVEIARQGCEIDPLMAPINYIYALLLYYAHRWEESEQQFRRTLEISPNFALAHAMRGVALARGGRFEDAKQLVQSIVGDIPEAFRELLLGYVAALAGDADTAKSIVAKYEGPGIAAAAWFGATIYGALGDLDQGFAQLDRARDLRFGILSSATVNPALEPFRKDPRWPGFLKSLNLGADVAA